MSKDPDIKPDTAKIAVPDIGTFEVPTGLNLREALRRKGVYLDGACADQGNCGRCIVRVVRGYVQPPSQKEAGILGRERIDVGERLACRITITGDMEITVSKERILEIEKTGRWKDVWDSPLWTSNPFPFSGSGFGIALDLGTTSIAAALYDLAQGRPLDIRSGSNPQITWGEEIISRLEAAQEPETAETLRDLLWERVNDLIRTLCLRSGVSQGRISRIVAVCNSAVHHLALGVPVGSLLTPPYEPQVAGSMEMPAGESPTRLRVAADARIYFPALAGGYAGSDAVVSVMAAISQGAEKGAVIDVGTNTEIAVWNGNVCMVATAPSGPAFEGGHMRWGMQAEEGAIWKVKIKEDDVSVEVIGEGQPKGICGTGIVDALAGMLENNIIEPSGLMRKGSHPCMMEDGFHLSQPGGVLIEPQDIATVQKAKGAIAATLETLLKRMNMGVGDLERLYLAGAFGSRLDAENAMSLGLLPRMGKDRLVSAGNSSLVGASFVLLSEEAREKAERLARSITHLSVAEDNRFEELFLDNLYFPQVQ